MKERAIIVGIGLKSDSFIELKESLAELEELVYAAGAEVVGTIIQTLHKFNPATLMGSGKIQEIKEMVANSQSTLVVVDHHLSGVQGRNLNEELGVKVMDRSQLILDIFAQRAKTFEGKLQVELAQLMDQLPRMVGAWQGSLSRQGGGIGTRGPGESALEIDRRRIHEKVKSIQKKLDSVKQHRSQHRAKRRKHQVPSFAMIGYTNSGKSTLLNKLTNSKVLVQNMVFATLDPATRRVHLPDVGYAVITDTVGFIRKLPTHLIEAFKATLEESAEADILLHVIDLSIDQMRRQKEIVEQLIQEFHWEKKPIMYIYNKVDKATIEKQVRADGHPRVMVSAHSGQGVERLKEMMANAIKELNHEVELYFPKDQEHKIYELGRESSIAKKEAGAEGTICVAYLTPDQLSRWQDYIVKQK